MIPARQLARLRASGLSAKVIARRLGTTPQAIRATKVWRQLVAADEGDARLTVVRSARDEAERAARVRRIKANIAASPSTPICYPEDRL